jgi:hypothetical protein
MTVLLANDFHAVIWRQHLLEPDSHAKSEHGSERAVGDGRGKFDSDMNDGIRTWHSKGRGGSDVNVGEVDDGQLAQRDGMFRISYVRNEI